MIVLGLTGSIGMGKSTTAAMIREAGVPVFDADAAVHAAYAAEAVAPVEAAFPGATREGAVDRARLRSAVVGNPPALKRLESIVHPIVRRRREAFLADARAQERPLVVLDIPLLFETGGEHEVDAVIVVTAPETVQKARVLARPGMTEDTFSQILAQQVPDAEKRRRATHVIDTGQGLAATRSQVASVLAGYRGNR